MATGAVATLALGTVPAQAFPVGGGGGGDDCVAASTGTLTVSPGTVLPGQSVTVSWDVQQIAGCTVWKSIDGVGFGGASVGNRGSRTVTVTTQGTATWSLTVSGSAGNVYTLDTASATVLPPLPALSPIAAARDSAGQLQTIMVRGDDVILRDHQFGANGDFGGWTYAPGLLRSVASETDGSGRVVQVGFNGGGQVWATIQDVPGGTGWVGWTGLDGLITSVALARNADGRLELFATNGSGTIFHRTQTAVGTVSFGGWATFPGLLKQVAAQTNADGRIEVVGVNSAGQIWHQSQTSVNSQTWSGWTQIPGTLGAIAIAGNTNGKLEIVGTDPGGSLFEATQTTAGGSAWDPFVTIPDGHGGPVAAEAGDNGRIVVFGLDGAGVMSYRTQVFAGSPSFTGWLPLTQYVAQPNPIGSPHNVRVVPVNWVASGSTPAAPQTRTLDQITAMIDPNVWNEFSYGQFPGWTVQGYQPLTIDTPRTDPTGGCSRQFEDDITASVGKAGINTGGDPIVYYFTGFGSCGYGGYAIGNGVFINGGDRMTLAHELGHELGLAHAHSKDCRDGSGARVPLSTSCAVIEYGDVNDVMGGFSTAGYNAIERQRLGWMSGRVTDVPAAGGTFTVAPLELTTPGLQALRINDGTTLWVEYRQPIGLDAHALPSPGVLVYQQPDASLESYQLDMTPSGAGVDLPVGGTWVNPLGSMKITVNWANSTGASITVAPAVPPVPVPYLIDETCGQALGDLQAVGLSGTCWGTGNYVGNQSPGGGTAVPPGTVVSLQMAVNPP